MSATFDATTKAAYDAATTAQARAEAIVASLTGTISVKVLNGSNTEMGSGTMAAPWATASAGVVTLGEVSSFTVGTTATPDADWYIRFENSDASRWVRGSFGLSGSGQDYTWSLATWTATQTGTIGTATIIASGNAAPAFTVAPTTASIAATGGTIQFTATDPEGGAILYSLPTTRSGITINASTGLVTVTSAAAGTSGNITVRASDGVLTADASCAVTVNAGAFKWYTGHYALPGAGDSQATKFALFDELGSGWQGAQVRYYWGDLESGFDDYDFSIIQADLDRLAVRGKRLFIQLLAAKFGANAQVENLVPSYLLTPAYNGGVADISDRIVIQLWNAAVMTRLIALEEALAAQFDHDVNIAGIVGGETALGQASQLAAFGYTDEGVLEQLERRATASRAAWDTTPVIIYANFFSGWSAANIQALYEHMETIGVGTGGPDIYPDNPTTGQDYYMGSVGAQDYRGVIPAGFANQAASVTGYTFENLYTFAKNTLEANFMFTLKSASSMTSWAATKAYVDANPTMVSTLPSVYS